MRLRAKILRNQGGNCAICEAPCSLEDATLDHIIPHSLGGATSSARNLRIAHGRCNWRRGGYCSPEEYSQGVIQTDFSLKSKRRRRQIEMKWNLAHQLIASVAKSALFRPFGKLGSRS